MHLLNEDLDKRREFNQFMKKVYGNEIWEKFDEFNTEKAVVWIDPLDGKQP